MPGKQHFHSFTFMCYGKREINAEKASCQMTKFCKSFCCHLVVNVVDLTISSIRMKVILSKSFGWAVVIACFSSSVHMSSFLASRDLCPGSLNVTAQPSASASVAWTKTLTLAITLLPEEMGLSYCTCVFLVTRPFTWYHSFWPRDLDHEVWPTFEKL